VPEWQFGGYIRAATPSLRAILEQAGYAIPLPGPFGDFEAGCDAVVSRRVRFFRTCVCISTGMNSKGPWRTRRATGSSFSGTLANKPAFRYGHFFPAFRLPLGAMANGIVIHLSLGGWLDRSRLRISAAHMLFSHFELEDAAFSVMRNSGRLELALAAPRHIKVRSRAA